MIKTASATPSQVRQISRLRAREVELEKEFNTAHLKHVVDYENMRCATVEELDKLADIIKKFKSVRRTAEKLSAAGAIRAESIAAPTTSVNPYLLDELCAANPPYSKFAKTTKLEAPTIEVFQERIAAKESRILLKYCSNATITATLNAYYEKIRGRAKNDKINDETVKQRKIRAEQVRAVRERRAIVEEENFQRTAQLAAEMSDMSEEMRAAIPSFAPARIAKRDPETKEPTVIVDVAAAASKFYAALKHTALRDEISDTVEDFAHPDELEQVLPRLSHKIVETIESDDEFRELRGYALQPELMVESVKKLFKREFSKKIERERAGATYSDEEM